jgi:hydroxylamine reductase
MFCYQCEQTAKGSGCTKAGVCGKDGATADLQDVLTHVTKGVAMLAHRARQAGGARDAAVDRFVVEALFTTVTNVNFDAARIEAMIRRGVEVRALAGGLYEAACRRAGRAPEVLNGPAVFQPASDRPGLAAQAAALGVQARKQRLGDDRAGVLEMALYGLKGAAAYADHALVLGREDEGVYAFFHAALDRLASEPPLDALVGLCLEVGAHNLKVMELLDRANTGTYGHPEPTSVRVSAVAGKAILVSGHDLRDLERLLQQTEGKGVNIYTHGEMLPALAYPGLKKYPHLVGNYGGAWQDQQREFEAFPGAVLMTTNCIQKPRESYQGRIFTTGLVAFPGVEHVSDKDFGPVVQAALAAPGFAADEPERRITIGFGRQAVLGVAGKVVEAVKAGKIKHFFLVGGCDGAKPGRNYYTEFAQAAPRDTVLLTLACGKYRFNKLELGDIDGIPRLLDVGQCNDAYSAVQIALALAQAFQTDVNSLPLNLVLSWYEQKAVAILLTLLHLGIRNIRLGPSLPAFVSPAVLQVLVDKFGIAPVTTPEADLKAMLKTA